MAKVTFIFIIATILFAVNSHPVEENVGTAKITPLVAAEAQQKQNETNKTKGPNSTHDSNNDSSRDCSESTRDNFETNVKDIFNKDRSKRNSDSAVDSTSSNEKPNVPGNVHGNFPNPRPVSSASREESSKEKENSSSNEDSLENKSKSSSNHATGDSVVPFLSTSNARQVRETVESKNHEAPKTDFAKTQTQTNVGSPVYSPRNTHSRPARPVSEKDDKSPSANTRTPGLQYASNNKEQRTDLLTERSISSKNVAPVPYSARNENVRKIREAVDSSEADSSNTTKEPVVYFTPQIRTLSASKFVSKEATAPASPAAAADSSKSVEEF